MADIAPYVRAVILLDAAPNFDFPLEYVRRDVLLNEIQRAVTSVLIPQGIYGQVDEEEVITQILDEFTMDGGIETVTDPFAGTYYKVVPRRVSELISAYANSDEIIIKSRQVGDSFFRDVFHGYLSGVPLEPSDALAGTTIPASDRTVLLDDNQARKIELPLNSLIENLEQDNGLPDAPGARERLLGQIKAGRELIRAGNFKAYALYVTLLHGLVELAKRYKETIIGAAAGKLVEMLVEQLFKAT